MNQTYLNYGVQATLLDRGVIAQTNQGGLAHQIDKWGQARRFLILGTESPTFYATEQKLTFDNVTSIGQCLDENGRKLVDMIVDVSDRALAPSNEPALFALALAASYKVKESDAYAADVRAYALANLPKVARMSTHLFHFITYLDSLRGWGPSVREAIGGWYTNRQNKWIAEQVTKYVQRDGWSHADVLRKSHPHAKNDEQNALFKYVVDGVVGSGGVFEYIDAVERVKHADAAEAIKLITDYNLPREVIPTALLNEPRVWEALLFAGRGMPMTALVRNLGNLSKHGVIAQGTDGSRVVINRLRDEEELKRARMHPIDFLKAKFVYQNGQGFRGGNTWNVNSAITAAIETAFYGSFKTITPTNKRIMLAIDISGSMTCGNVANVPGFTPNIAAAALALVTAKTETDYAIYGFSHRFVYLNITEHDSLESAMKKTYDQSFGATDCSLPMVFAQKNGLKYDAFCVYTDNENGSRILPSDALKEYRSKSGIHDAKLIANAMTAGRYSIADPRDPYMLDVVGFDSSAPAVMSEFIRGNI